MIFWLILTFAVFYQKYLKWKSFVSLFCYHFYWCLQLNVRGAKSLTLAASLDLGIIDPVGMAVGTDLLLVTEDPMDDPIMADLLISDLLIIDRLIILLMITINRLENTVNFWLNITFFRLFANCFLFRQTELDLNFNGFGKFKHCFKVWKILLFFELF